MDLAKYVALLKDRSLHFARLDTFNDPFEGSLSKAEYDRIKQVAEAGEKGKQLPTDWQGHYFDVLIGSTRRSRKENYVNCWHMNLCESEAMWRLYSSSGFAIAVQSTYQRLTNSLPSNFDPANHIGPFLGVIQYVDHHQDKFPSDNAFNATMHKRLSFKHENECRAVIWRVGPRNQQWPDGTPEHILATYPEGMKIPIKLEQLVERVVISPSAPKWFFDTVADLTSRYDCTFPIEHSSLAMPPYL